MEEKIKCWNCKKEIDSSDNYCRHCGKGQGGRMPFQFTHIGVIVFIVLAGPLALYYVWKSPRFSKNTKWIYVGLTILYSMLMWSMFNDMMKQYKDVMGSVGL